MKLGGLLALGAGVLSIATWATPAASAQLSVYAEASADQMSNTKTSKTAFGTTFGIQGEAYRHGHLRVYGDLQGFFYDGKGVEASNTRLNLGGVALGPKLGLAYKHVEPYMALLVGFARYNDGLGNINSSTTDNQVDGVFGVDVRISQRFDYRLIEFDYKHYSALGGEFNPKIISTGVVFHIGKR